MSNCYKDNVNNYELEKERIEVYENRKYLEKFDCCNEDSCDKLAYEYEKLLNKCHDVYSKTGILPVDEKGRLAEESLCDRINDKRNKFVRKRDKSTIKRNESIRKRNESIRERNESIIKREGGTKKSKRGVKRRRSRKVRRVSK